MAGNSMTLRSPILPSNFAEKLRITAVALNCRNQKEMAAAFYAINARTQFTAIRSYKWTQGRTVPRSGQVYSDWARLLDLGRSPQELLTCSIEQFRIWIVARYGPLADSHSRTGIQTIHRHHQGRFSCYIRDNQALPFGRVVRASLAIEMLSFGYAPMAHFAAAAIFNGQTDGPVKSFDSVMCLELTSSDLARPPIFVTLYDPNSDGAVFIGTMLSIPGDAKSGKAPLAMPLVAVRLPDGKPLERSHSHRFIDEGESLAADLAVQGLNIETVPDLDLVLRKALGEAQESFACRLGDACRRAMRHSSQPRGMWETFKVAPG